MLQALKYPKKGFHIQKDEKSTVRLSNQQENQMDKSNLSHKSSSATPSAMPVIRSIELVDQFIHGTIVGKRKSVN